jgi:hypothetical protein
MELSKRIYFGGPHARKRWENYKKLAQQHFRGSVAALIRDALSRTYNLDPETGEARSVSIDMVADAPRKSKPHKPRPRKSL